MNALALDLGTKFGYAIYKEGEIISGTERLSRKTLGSRFEEFRGLLKEIIS